MALISELEKGLNPKELVTANRNTASQNHPRRISVFTVLAVSG